MSIQLPSPILISAAQDTAIRTSANTVLTNATAIAPIDLDTDAKSALQTIDNIRWPYAQRTVQIHAANFPQVIPPFLSLPDAKTNYATMSSCRDYKALLFKAIEQVDEASQVAENNVFEFVRQMYDLGQQAQKAGTVPGIQSFLDDIAPLFEKGTSGTQPTPPTP